jgi:small subunit ribosomal protein S20
VANTRSSKKRMRQGAKRRAANRTQRAAVRTAVKRVRNAGDAGQAQEALKQAETLLDRAARKRVVHPNTAARQKSRLNAFVKKQAEG